MLVGGFRCGGLLYGKMFSDYHLELFIEGTRAFSTDVASKPEDDGTWCFPGDFPVPGLDTH